MSYNSFAEYYDGLMEDARYPERCRYILDIARRFGHDMGRTLDLCCGTGSLTLELARCGVDVFGIDRSGEMLSEAMQKSIAEGRHILFAQQSMERLRLPELIDTCVCTLDSLNHLTDIGDVRSTFERLARSMKAGGMFIFDVNTVYKHREVLADNVFVMENERVFCVWQNFPREDDITDIALDFFVEENGVYTRFSEDFSERAYSGEELEKLLDEAGFDVAAVYGDLSFEPPGADEQRAVYVAVKR